MHTSQTSSRGSKEHCLKCHGFVQTECQLDYEIGTKATVQYCVNCGARQAWGPVEQVA